MANKKDQPVDWESLLAGITRGKTIIEYGTNRNIFRQGQAADSLFYLRRGKVKLAVTSKDGREAIVAMQSGLLSVVLHDYYPSGIHIESSVISTGPHIVIFPYLLDMSNLDQMREQL